MFVYFKDLFDEVACIVLVHDLHSSITVLLNQQMTVLYHFCPIIHISFPCNKTANPNLAMPGTCLCKDTIIQSLI